MKRLIALLIVVVFCISIFATPASAICPDPEDARFVRGETPNGDDSGWADPHAKGTEIDERPMYSGNRLLAFNVRFVAIVYLGRDKVRRNLLKKDEQTDHRGSLGDRSSSPPR